jgi:hypothetical protein
VTVGVAWPANEAVLLEIARNDLGGATAAKGTMKLENVEGAGDNQVFNISGNILFEGVKSPITAPLTPGPAVVKAQLTRSIPATAGKGVLKQSSITSLEASGFADMPSASPSGSSTPINVHAEVMVTEQKKWGVEITFR